MTIEIKKENHYFAIWQAEMTDHVGNYMACMWREPDGQIYLKYRFRRYVDDKIFDSNDEKRWVLSMARPGTTPGTLKAAADDVLRRGRAEGIFMDGWCIEINGDGDAAAAILSNPERPCFHLKNMTPEEYAKQQEE